jgi:hypothetical protein
MKTSRLKALRFPILILLGFGVLAGAMLVFANSLRANAPPATPRVARVYYPSGPDAVNAKGMHFVIEDLFVEGDKLNLRYHATGVTAVGFDQAGPMYGNQPPTVINVVGAGVTFIPFDASVGGEQGSQLIHGEFIWRFQGAPPRHLDISVVRLMGDVDATWTVHVDR